MKRILAGAGALVALALACTPSQAARYDFDFTTQAGFTVSGQVTTASALNAVGGYDVTGISGSVKSTGLRETIDGLVTNPTQPDYYNNGSWIYNNVVYKASPYVDYWGVLFAASGVGGSYDYNIYSSGGSYYLSSNAPGGVMAGDLVTSGRVNAVPESATWLLVCAGFVALGYVGHHARKNRLAGLG